MTLKIWKVVKLRVRANIRIRILASGLVEVVLNSRALEFLKSIQKLQCVINKKFNTLQWMSNASTENE